MLVFAKKMASCQIKKSIQEIEPKLFTAYKYHLLDKIQDKNILIMN